MLDERGTGQLSDATCPRLAHVQSQSTPPAPEAPPGTFSTPLWTCAWLGGGLEQTGAPSLVMTAQLTLHGGQSNSSDNNNASHLAEA